MYVTVTTFVFSNINVLQKANVYVFSLVRVQDQGDLRNHYNELGCFFNNRLKQEELLRHLMQETDNGRLIVLRDVFLL